MTFDEYLEDLTDGEEPLAHSSHLHLSDLAAEELEDFSAAWPDVPVARKTKLLGILTELADDNVELDFSQVFRAAIGDPDGKVRESAVKGLWETEDRALIRPLTRMLARDPEPSVRAATAVTLRRFAERAQAGRLIEKDAARVRAALMSAIGRSDEETEVTRRAIEAASHFESADVDAAIGAAHLSRDPLLRQSALFAMGNSVHLEWMETLIEALGSDDAAVRFEAAGSLGRLGEQSVVAHLVPLLTDDDPQVQVVTATALGAVGGRLAKRALQRCLELGDEPLEQAARAALADVAFEDDPLGVQFEE